MSQRALVLLASCTAGLAIFAGCSDNRTATGGNRLPPTGNRTDSGVVTDPTDAGSNPMPGATCGNGEINGLEPCDGTTFAPGRGRTCDAYGLGNGAVTCTSDCKLSFAGCAQRDYCMANNLYANGTCDNCEFLGGHADAECATACGMNGMCADRFDEVTGAWTCRSHMMADPDCGTCGNGTIEGNERCDGTAFAGGKDTCQAWGYIAGNLTCKPDCSPSFSECRVAVCGDGMIEGRETCDGSNLGMQSCQSQGFLQGMLTCTSTCGFNRSQCVRPGCGNGIIEPNRNEDCDGTNLDNKTCQMVGEFSGGTLACAANCEFDTTRCVRPGCNNGVLDMGEDCEGTMLNGQTCMSQGFLQGTLRCSSMSCTFDTSMCVAPGCGNNIIESPMEQCEGSNLNMQTCATQGFLQGTLRCDGNCRFDTSMCVMAGCGNGIIEAPMEQCEGMNLNGATCRSLGNAGGTLSCNSSCRFDTSMCVMGGCGNGIIETPAEQCEGMNLNGATCQSQGFTGGTLGCSMGCQLDTSRCTRSMNHCGDGVINGVEACDGNDLGDIDPSCMANNLGTGTIRCTPSCTLSTAGCTMPDLCTAGQFYNDGVCDDCQNMGGMPDPDCAGCGANSACVDYFNVFTGRFTCPGSGRSRDPDCGCGNGTAAGVQSQVIVEMCDGMSIAPGFSCVERGFTAGTPTCNASCAADYATCR